ncbi:MAG TPA: amidohydrolase family protein [Clostridia bacterium]
MIIDFHTHCFPDNLYERAISEISTKSKVYPSFDGSVGGLIRSMKEAGIDRCVVANIATNAKQTPKVNSFAIECSKYQELIPFGSVHPEFEDYKAEIDRLCEKHILGLKFHPHYQSYTIDDPKMMKVYEYALSKNMVLLFHMGRDRALPDAQNATPKRMRNLVDAFNTPKIVAAHMGGEGYREEFEKYLLGTTISIDTSFAFTRMSLDDIKKILDHHNPEYILFATDAPWADQGDELLQYYNMNIPQKTLDLILGGNALRLLKSVK